MSDRLQTKYDFRDLLDVPQSFTGLEITDAGAGEIFLPNEALFFLDNFLLNTQSDGLGTNITGFQFIDKNDFMSDKWGLSVYEKIKITDGAYQTGTIYAFGDIAGSDLKATDANRLQTQIDSLNSGTNNLDVGSIHYYSTFKERAGLKPFAFDNALSQANYSVLWDEIGHQYNDAHVDAGDTDLSASSDLFYPTPIPTGYGRTGFPDTFYDDTDIDAGNSWMDASDFFYADASPRFRDGTPFYIKDITGIFSATGYTAGDLVYINASKTGTTNIFLYPTEADAIADTSNFTNMVTTGTFRLTQEGIAIDDALEEHEHRFNRTSTLAGDLGTTRNVFNNTSNSDTEVLQVINASVSNETRPKTYYEFGYIKVESIASNGEAISALRYDTGWIANSAWSNAELNVIHNLNTGLSDIAVNITISIDGTDSTAFKIENNARIGITSLTSGTNDGMTVFQVDINSLKIQTGADGVVYLNDDGVYVRIDTEAWYYKVVVTKPNLTATAFDVDELPKTFDISSTSEVRTLPEINGVLQRKRYYWEGGDGSNTFSLAVSDGATVGGIAATLWTGEGDGNIDLESDGVSDWKVIDYTDYITDGVDQRIWKEKDGTEKQDIIQTVNTTISTTNGSLFHSGFKAGITRFHTLFSILAETVDLQEVIQNLCWVGRHTAEGTTTTTSSFYLLDSVADAVSRNYTITAKSTGRWRT